MNRSVKKKKLISGAGIASSNNDHESPAFLIRLAEDSTENLVVFDDERAAVSSLMQKRSYVTSDGYLISLLEPTASPTLQSKTVDNSINDSGSIKIEYLEDDDNITEDQKMIVEPEIQEGCSYNVLEQPPEVYENPEAGMCWFGCKFPIFASSWWKKLGPSTSR